ncbi:MAG: Uma2 family endonuclease [Cyanobacteriota bacterium]|nr:Uma2 family endonuclease [Cyanobacteriota bacterium]
MALAPPPSTAQPAELEPATLLLPWDLRLTPEQFEPVRQANPEAVLELTADGALIAMTPTGGETGSRNGLLVYQLQGFCMQRKAWRLFDSSTGFLAFSSEKECSAEMSRAFDGLPAPYLVDVSHWQTL